MQWSSDQYGELPLAVRVTLTMKDPIAERIAEFQGATADASPTRKFVHVVRLPLARPVVETEEEELSEAGL